MRELKIEVRDSRSLSDLRAGDHVIWTSEAGHVSDTIIKVHTRDVDYKGYTYRASTDDPQYEIKSARSVKSRCVRAPR